jgi:predicted short-subunit dehydrogenase-like oxidoreductase (DUF2520 family)
VLTGPVARGDAATVRAHVAAIETDDVVLDVYRSLSRAAVRLMRQSPAADRMRLDEVEAALQETGPGRPG